MHLTKCFQVTGCRSDRRLFNGFDRHWSRSFVQYLTFANRMLPFGRHSNRSISRHIHKFCFCNLHANLPTVGVVIYDTYKHHDFSRNTAWDKHCQIHGQLLWWKSVRSSICLCASNPGCRSELSSRRNLHYDQEARNGRTNF